MANAELTDLQLLAVLRQATLHHFQVVSTEQWNRDSRGEMILDDAHQRQMTAVFDSLPVVAQKRLRTFSFTRLQQIADPKLLQALRSALARVQARQLCYQYFGCQPVTVSEATQSLLQRSLKNVAIEVLDVN